jgi:transglutaminase/protease-like cytokinesis protein 3
MDFEIIEIEEPVKEKRKSILFPFVKLVLTLSIFSGVIFSVFYYEEIFKYIAYNYIYKHEIQIQPITTYQKEETYFQFELVDKFIAQNKQDLANIIYTAINNGWIEFSFLCEYNYNECQNDLTDLVSTSEGEQEGMLNYINNFVHPYNSFDRLSLSMNSYGKVTIKMTPIYSDSQIREIDAWVDNVLANKINDSMTLKNKIKTIHDHIINETKYDKVRAEAIKIGGKIDDNYSHSAYGIVRDKEAVCGGYTDLMAIFLERLKVPNYKISTDDHIWNLVFFDNLWLHLDLTWNDPVMPDGRNALLHTFFLIDTKQLHKEDSSQHNFNPYYFKEAM